MSLHKRHVLTLTLASFLVINTSFAKARVEHNNYKENSHNSLKDLGVVNKERIVYWLIKRGELSKSSSEKEKAEAIKKYIDSKKVHHLDYVHEIDGKKVVNYTAVNKKAREQKKTHKDQRKEETVHEVNILTLLIDFPDLPHNDNQLTANDTAMFYDNYSVEHYQNLMFSESGFSGPNGELLNSAHQYFLSESGGSFKFNGKVFGWLTADHNASYYGANNSYGNDQAATDLVKEAIDKAAATYNIDLADYDKVDPADLDNDGIINEPDGYIDYLMVYHSSVGADAGGGILGHDAIWSHRWNVNNHSIGQTGYKAHGYTIQGIDSAIGVVSHEFGHLVANLKDEYDTANSAPNSPVGFWSIMSGGSWAGNNIAGSMPTGFSPIAKEQLQNNFGGNWYVSEHLNMDDLIENPKTIDIVESVNHDGSTNLIDISIPIHRVIKPYSGENFFHSGKGDNLNNKMILNIDVPNENKVSINMKAYWDIEKEWDYVRFLINDEPAPLNHSQKSNEESITFNYMGLIEHYLTGQSKDINHGWVDLNLDLSEYLGQSIEISIEYVTDTNTGGEGFFLDDITLLINDNFTVLDSADGENLASYNGFELTSTYVNTNYDRQNYYIQLRSHNDVDKGLEHASYDKGILMWFGDKNFSTNQSSVHPGRGFISVIDADQNLIKDDVYGVWWSTNQIRDAVFSLFDQREKSADYDLNAITTFKDTNSFINIEQPESGIKLPIWGINMTVLEQTEESTSATLALSKTELDLTSLFQVASKNKMSIAFDNLSYGGKEWLAYRWDFGDNSDISFENNPNYSYKEVGQFTVTLEASDSTGATHVFEKLIKTEGANFSFTADALTVSFENSSSWGSDQLTYNWDFGDGNSSEHISPTHRYDEPGDYIVKLTVKSESEAILDIEKTVTVLNITAPSAQFSTQSEGLSVQTFNATSYGKGKLIYTWDFGDGSYKKTGTSPKHIYGAPGFYKIVMQVKDELGRVSTIEHSVEVNKETQSHSGGAISITFFFFIFYVFCNKYRELFNRNR